MQQDHSRHQTDLPLKMQILNISVNMARLGELVLRFGDSKHELRQKFLDQTESYLSDLNSENVSVPFSLTLNRFKKEFKKLRDQKVDTENKLLWAERAITWADILQLRSKAAG